MYYFYQIKNKMTNQSYIGQTINFDRRKKRHLNELRNDKHHSYRLQQAFNEFGEENFDFNLIKTVENCDDQKVTEIEKELIKKFKSFDNGYNCHEGKYDHTKKIGKLKKFEIFNILSVIEFSSRPGQVLADIYNITRTTVSRIKRLESYSEWGKEYYKLSVNLRKNIFNKFCHESDFISKKVNSTIIKSKRKLSKEQVFFILAVKEFDIRIEVGRFKKMFNLKSTNTFQCIYQHKSYQDYYLEYIKLPQEKKQTILHHYIEIYNSKAF